MSQDDPVITPEQAQELEGLVKDPSPCHRNHQTRTFTALCEIALRYRKGNPNHPPPASVLSMLETGYCSCGFANALTVSASLLRKNSVAVASTAGSTGEVRSMSTADDSPIITRKQADELENLVPKDPEPPRLCHTYRQRPETLCGLILDLKGTFHHRPSPSIKALLEVGYCSCGRKKCPDCLRIEAAQHFR